jgi:hypothetical protein
MNLWLDIGGVVKQDIEHVVAFVLVCADDVGIDGDMVGNERIGVVSSKRRKFRQALFHDIFRPDRIESTIAEALSAKKAQGQIRGKAEGRLAEKHV